MTYIHIFDTTLRDGMQTPYVGVNKEGRNIIAEKIAQTQVDVMEIGFAANAVDYTWMPSIAQTVCDTNDSIEICGLARLHKDDIDKTSHVLQNVLPTKRRIHVFIGSSNQLCQYSLQKSEKEVLERVKRFVSYAKEKFPEGTIQFSAEDATRTQRDYLSQIIDTAVSCGTTVINIPDTVGTTSIHNYGELIQYLQKNHPSVSTWSTHNHDDRGLSIATSLSGVYAGATQVEGTICGIGERAGNCDWIVFAENALLEGYEVGVNRKKYMDANNIVKKYALSGVQNCQAVWGNIQMVSSGIHTNASLRKKGIYQPLDLDAIGKVEELVLGQTSGSAVVQAKLLEYGLPIPNDLIGFTRKINFFCAKHNGVITQSDLEKLL